MCTFCLGEAKPLLGCCCSLSLIQCPTGGKERAWWSLPWREILFIWLFCLWCDPEQQLQCPSVAAMKRRNPRNGADTTRKHLTFEICLLNWKGRKGGSCPDHFKRQGTQGVKQFLMTGSKSAPSDAFLPLLSHRREPTCCPSLPAQPFGDKELGWCRAAATWVELLSFVFFLNKTKKLGGVIKRKKKVCKELHSLRKQDRRHRRGLWFVSQTWLRFDHFIARWAARKGSANSHHTSCPSKVVHKPILGVESLQTSWDIPGSGSPDEKVFQSTCMWRKMRQRSCKKKKQRGLWGELKCTTETTVLSVFDSSSSFHHLQSSSWGCCSDQTGWENICCGPDPSLSWQLTLCSPATCVRDGASPCSSPCSQQDRWGFALAVTGMVLHELCPVLS